MERGAHSQRSDEGEELHDGPADALLHGEAVFHTVVHGGFASVRNDVIRIITDSAVETEEKTDTENED